MKCLSLMQPWASLIAVGAKTIETRSWKTNYRGELYIHASAKTDKNSLTSIPIKETLENEELLNSCIIAKCELVDCKLMTKELIEEVKNIGNEYHFGVYEEGRYAWYLQNVEILNSPIEAKGKLGIWNY